MLKTVQGPGGIPGRIRRGIKRERHDGKVIDLEMNLMQMKNVPLLGGVLNDPVLRFAGHECCDWWFIGPVGVQGVLHGLGTSLRGGDIFIKCEGGGVFLG